MLDIEKCTYEEDWYDKDQQTHTFYFSYSDLYSNGLFDEPLGKYGNVIGTSIMLEIYQNSGQLRSRLALSPTVFETDQLSDVQWEEPRYGYDYNSDFVIGLLKLVNQNKLDRIKRKIVKVLNIVEELNNELEEYEN